MSPMKLDALREEGDLVFEGVDRDEYGNKIEVSCPSCIHFLLSNGLSILRIVRWHCLGGL